MRRGDGVLLWLLIAIGVLLPDGIVGAEADALAVGPHDCIIEPARMPQPGDVGNLATPAPSPTPIVIAGGTPADVGTVIAVTERIATAIACHNAGDVLRMLANFSERWIEERFSGYDLVFFGRFQDAAEQPEPLPAADRIELVSVDEVVLLGDDRVAATVTTRFHGEHQVSRVVLVETSGAWLIDGGEVAPN